jgi:uncharacterized membrane protein YkgB
MAASPSQPPLYQESPMKPINVLTMAQHNAFTSSNAKFLQWSLFVVFLWFGAMKFTNYEAQGIAPFIANSPVMSWLHSLFGVRGAAPLLCH